MTLPPSPKKLHLINGSLYLPLTSHVSGTILEHPGFLTFVMMIWSTDEEAESRVDMDKDAGMKVCKHTPFHAHPPLTPVLWSPVPSAKRQRQEPTLVFMTVKRMFSAACHSAASCFPKQQPPRIRPSHPSYYGLVKCQGHTLHTIMS